jgi:hypothetical protein
MVHNSGLYLTMSLMSACRLPSCCRFGLKFLFDSAAEVGESCDRIGLWKCGQNKD